MFGTNPDSKFYMNIDETKETTGFSSTDGSLPPSFATFSVSLGQNIVYQTRKVYSLLDFLGDIGGL
jgi:hypothetical protein